MSESDIICTLEKKNREQRLLIQSLINALHDPVAKQQMYNLIMKSSQQNTDLKIIELFDKIHQKLSDQPITNEVDNERIIQLKQQIQEKQEKIQQLDENLIQYNEAARQLEEQLAQIELEKAQILQGFQDKDSVQNSELRRQLSELTRSKSKLELITQQSQDLLIEVEDKIGDCQQTERDFQAQVEYEKQRLRQSTHETNAQRLAEIDDEIDSLSKEIDEKTRVLAQLKNEYQMLMQRLNDTDSL